MKVIPFFIIFVQYLKTGIMNQDKIKEVVNKFGVQTAIKLFGGNKDIIKQAYQDNPMTFLNQFNNLTQDNIGFVMYYRDKDNKILFYHKQGEKNGTCVIDNDRIWLFFKLIMGYNYTEIQQLMKEWLGLTYNLGGFTPKNKFRKWN